MAKQQRLKFFISYRTSDNADLVDLIATRIGAQYGEENVFLDLDKIQNYQRFEDVIREYIQQADVLLLIIGPKWLDELQRRERDGDRDYVLLEVRTALDNGCFVAPLGIVSHNHPNLDAIPADIRHVFELHYPVIHNRQDLRTKLPTVLADIQRTVAPPPTPRKYVPLAAIGVVLAIVLLLVGGFAATQLLSSEDDVPTTAPTDITENTVRVEITSPLEDTVVVGTISILGSIVHPQLQDYTLQLSDNRSEYLIISGPDTREVDNGVLAIFDTTRYPNGPYYLRLFVNLTDGSFVVAELDTPIFINNPLPTRTPEPNTVATYTSAQPATASTPAFDTFSATHQVNSFTLTVDQPIGWQFTNYRSTTDLNYLFIVEDVSVAQDLTLLADGLDYETMQQPDSVGSGLVINVFRDASGEFPTSDGAAEVGLQIVDDWQESIGGNFTYTSPIAVENPTASVVRFNISAFGGDSYLYVLVQDDLILIAHAIGKVDGLDAVVGSIVIGDEDTLVNNPTPNPGINDPAIIIVDPPRSVTVGDTIAVPFSISDVDGDAVSVSPDSTQYAFIAWSIDYDDDGTGGTLYLTGTSVGTQFITLTARDERGGSSSVVLTINVLSGE